MQDHSSKREKGVGKGWRKEYVFSSLHNLDNFKVWLATMLCLIHFHTRFKVEFIAILGL